MTDILAILNIKYFIKTGTFSLGYSLKIKNLKKTKDLFIKTLDVNLKQYNQWSFDDTS